MADKTAGDQRIHDQEIPRPKVRAAFREMPGEAEADAAREVFLHGKRSGLSDIASTLLGPNLPDMNLSNNLESREEGDDRSLLPERSQR